MKFNPTWQQVALLAVLLTAIIVSHALFPASASAVVSIVSTIVGALFVDMKRNAAEGKKDEEKGGNA